MGYETPIIIGVGDIKNRSTAITDAKEPATLMLEAIRIALDDASSSSSSSSSVNELQAAIDSIDVVKTWTWPYPDLPGLLAQKLEVEESVKWKRCSEHGGDKPGRLVDEAARRIARGECGVAVVVGGEALASLSACAAAKQLPPPGWTAPSEAVDSVFTPTGRNLGNNVGAVHQIGAPIHVYPLYENAFRAYRKQSIQANHAESAKLYAEFSKVAERCEYAWNQGKSDSEEVIATIGKKNRMICFPYPLLMNAFNTVNLASAIILTSASFAQTLHIPASKWIYPLGGAATKDSDDFWKRPNFYTSPSISRSIDACIQVSGISKQDIDIVDLYSCFPIVPKIAATHLGLPITGGGKSLTLLGGLTSFGGAGNNYSMHALTALTRALRDGKGEVGLVLCNGGVMSYQCAVILSKKPREAGEYPVENPLPEQITDVEVPELAVNPEGEAVVETYTVEFGRDGRPLRGHIVGRLKSDGKRFLANHGDEATLRQMASGVEEIVGKSGLVWQDEEKEGRGLFSFDKPSRL
ncbi:acetyl-CoA acetyltransferas-like protein [Plenodomus tracheiphilus IPT5]|uniref:Acetyl-CoA acetyltransferas-like protein n=1 Tax=Plenodomus tracheiphilus IPT5 TaxID=1408161 RepID=A0A6A7B6E2_9PLEO|nr:acetyl-CoA acetyltransferas-like protein [Plenodomus tracheiphilus IPT5]